MTVEGCDTTNNGYMALSLDPVDDQRWRWNGEGGVGEAAKKKGLSFWPMNVLR